MKRGTIAVRVSTRGVIGVSGSGTQVVLSVGYNRSANLSRDFVLSIQDGLLVISDGQRRISGIDLALAGDGPGTIVNSAEPHKEGR